MKRGGGARLCLVTLALVGGGCARYQPQPIDTTALVKEYRARRLDDPALAEWIAKWAGAVSPVGWTDRQLAVAALRLRAKIRRARADWRVARASERTAAGRPQPGVSADVERAVSGSAGSSPWVVALSGLHTLELGGKRSARVHQARARTAAAEAELGIAVWEVVRETRSAALGVTLAQRDRDVVAGELAAISNVQTLERQRFAEASATSSEVARTAGEVEDVRGAAAIAEREWIEARAALSAAIGLPPRAFDSIDVAPVASTACEWLDSLGVDSLQAVALTNRPEIGRALAGYVGAEADLRLQVARQFPDLDLGPGFIWDQGVHRWTLALALPALFAFRNRGPITEAEAARAAAGARVMETQDSVLRELALAGEGCRGARIERAAADSQVAAAARNLERAQGAYQRGETGRLDAALADLAMARAAKASRAAQRRIELSSFAVEAATGEWRGEGGAGWPAPQTDWEEEVPK